MRFRLPFTKLQGKASRVGRAIWLQLRGAPTWTPRDYSHLAREAYERNVVAYRCIRMTAEAAASVPWGVIVDGVKGFDHPLLELLKTPNPQQGGVDLMESLYSYFLIAGNAFLEPVSLDNEIRELWSLRPDRMRARLNERGFPAVWEYRVNAEPVKFQMSIMSDEQQPILHLKAFHPTHDVYGLSPIEPGAFSIDVHSEASKYNKALLENGARPSGALKYEPTDKGADQNLSDEQFARLKREIEEKHQGAENSGRPLLLDGGLDWVDMSINPKDLDFILGKQEVAREIALAFGVPPQILGIPGDNSYSNYVEANRAFFRQAVLPLVGKFCSALTNFFRPTWPEMRLWYDTDNLPALISEREAHWKKIGNANWLTIDEAREATGFGELEVTDKPGGKLKSASSQRRGDRGADDGDRKPAEQP